MKGFTIIELMISLFIGMVVFGGVFSTFKNQNAIYSRQEMRIRMNQDIRVALDFMQRYLKTAGISAPECVQNDNAASNTNICSGIESTSTANKIVFTSDKNLSGTIQNATGTSDMQKFFSAERMAFIAEPAVPSSANPSNIYLCYDTVVYLPSNQCQFLIGNVTQFNVIYRRVNSSGTVVVANPISTASQIDITLRVRSTKVDSVGISGTNTNASGYLESSTINTTVYLINKANTNLMQ